MDIATYKTGTSILKSAIYRSLTSSKGYFSELALLPVKFGAAGFALVLQGELEISLRDCSTDL